VLAVRNLKHAFELAIFLEQRVEFGPACMGNCFASEKKGVYAAKWCAAAARAGASDWLKRDFQ
jgi:hypothetical protein